MVVEPGTKHRLARLIIDILEGFESRLALNGSLFLRQLGVAAKNERLVENPLGRNPGIELEGVDKGKIEIATEYAGIHLSGKSVLEGKSDSRMLLTELSQKRQHDTVPEL